MIYFLEIQKERFYFPIVRAHETKVNTDYWTSIGRVGVWLWNLLPTSDIPNARSSEAQPRNTRKNDHPQLRGWNNKWQGRCVLQRTICQRSKRTNRRQERGNVTIHLDNQTRILRTSWIANRRHLQPSPVASDMQVEQRLLCDKRHQFPLDDSEKSLLIGKSPGCLIYARIRLSRRSFS